MIGFLLGFTITAYIGYIFADIKMHRQINELQTKIEKLEMFIQDHKDKGGR